MRISLYRWAECSLINLALALHEGPNFNFPLGIDARPHIQYFCEPKTPNLNLKMKILKSPKPSPPYTCPNTQGCLRSVTRGLHSFQFLLVFPLADLSYFLVSSALLVENDFYILFCISRNFEIGEFSGHLICHSVGNGDTPTHTHTHTHQDIIVKSTNLITPYYIDIRN